MRRLPIYFLIDVSESMVGEPLSSVEEGLATIIGQLKRDPYALETVCVSIIVFAGKAEKIIPLLELYQFYTPKLPIGGGTSLGKAFELLIDDIDHNVRKTTTEQKGDWKPIVFLFTDGKPTDNFEKSLCTWNQKYKDKANVVAVSFGDNSNIDILGKFSQNVLIFKNTTNEDYKKFFEWVTASIQSSCKSISTSNDDSVKIAPTSQMFLSKIDLSKKQQNIIDDRFAVFIAKCQKTKRLYLIKYQRNIQKSEMPGLDIDVRNYTLIGAYAIDQSYYRLSDEREFENKISSEELIGFPHCPCCENKYGFSYCGCGKLLCTNDAELNTCPWCGNISAYNSGAGSININRTVG